MRSSASHSTTRASAGSPSFRSARSSQRGSGGTPTTRTSSGAERDPRGDFAGAVPALGVAVGIAVRVGVDVAVPVRARVAVAAFEPERGLRAEPELRPEPDQPGEARRLARSRADRLVALEPRRPRADDHEAATLRLRVDRLRQERGDVGLLDGELAER